jgi:hypothetical protein
VAGGFIDTVYMNEERRHYWCEKRGYYWPFHCWLAWGWI